MKRNKDVMEHMIKTAVSTDSKFKLNKRKKLPKIDYDPIIYELSLMKEASDTLNNARLNSQILRYTSRSNTINPSHTSDQSMRYEVDSKMNILSLESGDYHPTFYQFLDGQIFSGVNFYYYVSYNFELKRTSIAILTPSMLAEIKDIILQL